MSGEIQDEPGGINRPALMISVRYDPSLPKDLALAQVILESARSFGVTGNDLRNVLNFIIARSDALLSG